jgi:hypothetical protein
MSIVTGWVFALVCAAGTPADQCREEALTGYYYQDAESCKLDNAGDPRPNARCVEVQVIHAPGEDASAGAIEKVLSELDDSAGRG